MHTARFGLPFIQPAKLQFGESNYRPDTVGEDSILPRSISPQKAIMLGEFVSMSNIFPFNRTLKNRNLAGG